MCVVKYFIERLIHHGSVCVCFSKCLYSLPSQYHLKRKVYICSSANLVSERFHLLLGNATASCQCLENICDLRKGRDFSNVACANPISHSPPACSLSSPLLDSMTMSSPATILVATAQEHPISCGSPGFPCLCISWEAEVRTLRSWQVGLAFSTSHCFPELF